MLFYLNALLGLLIVVPALITATRYRQLPTDYRPLALLLWAGAANELFSVSIILSGNSNVVLYNSYSLAEALLLTWQFRKWGVRMASRRRFYLVIPLLLTTGWCINYLYAGSEAFLSGFLMVRSGLMILLCSCCIAQELYPGKGPFRQNPVIAVCGALLPYYVYDLFIEFLLMQDPYPNGFFQPALVLIVSAVNVYTNLLLTYAVLWIPQPLRYSLK